MIVLLEQQDRAAVASIDTSDCSSCLSGKMAVMHATSHSLIYGLLEVITIHVSTMSRAEWGVRRICE